MTSPSLDISAPMEPCATSKWRAALAWRIDPRQTLRVAVGRYHQLPSVEDLDPRYGNPSLHPLRADHAIAGYEWKDEHTNARFELYRKDYHDLITRSAQSWLCLPKCRLASPSQSRAAIFGCADSSNPS